MKQLDKEAEGMSIFAAGTNEQLVGFMVGQDSDPDLYRNDSFAKPVKEP
ncbi:MAG TPA: hypothetical protein VFM05_10390 [Candidatus Saccharimonadales bacterium]|nr:hypothetical protein [Candidatus Saccharimonadales bacterium]